MQKTYKKIAALVTRKSLDNLTAGLEPPNLAGLLDRVAYACRQPDTCMDQYIKFLAEDAAYVRVCVDRIDTAIARIRELRKVHKANYSRKK